MFRRIAGFIKQFFKSKRFRRGLYVFLGAFAASYIYHVILLISIFMDSGSSLEEALRLYFSHPLFDAGMLSYIAGFPLGVAIGFTLCFNRRRENRETDEQEEKPEESSDTVREEEIIETTHYKYQ